MKTAIKILAVICIFLVAREEFHKICHKVSHATRSHKHHKSESLFGGISFSAPTVASVSDPIGDNTGKSVKTGIDKVVNSYDVGSIADSATKGASKIGNEATKDVKDGIQKQMEDKVSDMSPF